MAHIQDQDVSEVVTEGQWRAQNEVVMCGLRLSVILSPLASFHVITSAV